MPELLYFDRDLVVLVKPVGLVSEDGGAGESVIPAAAAALRDAGERETTLYPVHRLDRNVGGVMVYARTKQAAAALSASVQDGGLEKVYLALAHGAPDAPRGTYRVSNVRRGVREAVLDYETLAAVGDCTLVRVRLHTGRSHQIRVQFASRKMPLVGDGKYGAKDNAKALGLFSHSLTFPHPKDGREMHVSALPTDALFTEALRAAGLQA